MPPSKQKKGAAIEQAKSLKNVPWCEEYERMISGMLYNGFDPEIVGAKMRARRLMHKYNNYFPDDMGAVALIAAREQMLMEMLAKAEAGAYIQPPFSVDFGCNISVGARFFANYNFTVLDCGLVTIGDRVICGPFVSIFAATHETDVQSRRDMVEYAGSVVIGDDCWIGGHVTILPGVTIGEGCTVGAGSVVTRDIPAWSVAVGSPARVIKKVKPVPPLIEEAKSLEVKRVIHEA